MPTREDSPKASTVSGLRYILRHFMVYACCVALWLPAKAHTSAADPTRETLPLAKSTNSVSRHLPRIKLNLNNTPGDSTNTLVISQPGFYYLAANLTGDPGKNGISIRANDVTLDLNGFALVAGGGGNFRGIDVPAPQSNFHILNGSVRGWTDGGVRAENSVTLAENLRLSDNTDATGLAVGNGSIISNCVATHNYIGFYLPDRCQVSGCISTLNTGDGFLCTSYVNVLDCTASRNTGAGIVVAGSGSVNQCSATRNDQDGINGGPGCTIADCAAGVNSFNGIVADFGSTVRNCTAQSNLLSGIKVVDYCQVIGNTCDSNNSSLPGGGGINANTGNWIENNSSTSNHSGYGFAITGSDCMLVRNSAHGNGTAAFLIPPSSHYGTIVDITANNPTGVSGSSAASTLTSTDPGANYVY